MIDVIVGVVDEVLWLLWLWIQIVCTIIGAMIGRKIGKMFLSGYPEEFTWIMIIVFAYLGYKSAVLAMTMVALSAVAVLLLAIFTPIGAYLVSLLTGIGETTRTALEEKVRRRLSG